MQTAFAEVEPLVCYSVKANSNLSILRVMAEHDSGFDVVSGGELYRVEVAAGRDGPDGLRRGRQDRRGDRRRVEGGVLMFNVESEAELDAIARVADSVGMIKAPVAFRVNPDVDPKTHRYISTGKKESKFGMDIDRSLALAEAVEGLKSVSDDRRPHAHRLADHDDRALRRRGGQGGRHHRPAPRDGPPDRLVQHGRGVRDRLSGNEARPVAEFAEAVVPAIKATGCRLAMEPGRVIAGNSGILVSRVLYTKQSGDKRFLIQDAAMNDLIRPALYESFHRIWPVDVPPGLPAPPTTTKASDRGDRALGRGRPGLRERRLPGQGPRLAPARPRGLARHRSRPAPTGW